MNNNSKTFNYIAYGSNLHPYRLMQRCPSARLLGTSIMRGYQLLFNKLSNDASVKCNVVASNDVSTNIYVAVFEINKSEELKLDRAEGKGLGYNDCIVKIKLRESEIAAKIYFADPGSIGEGKPYDWYKTMVIMGMQYHNFSDDYINLIQKVESQSDMSQVRMTANIAILQKMKSFSDTSP